MLSNSMTVFCNSHSFKLNRHPEFSSGSITSFNRQKKVDPETSSG